MPILTAAVVVLAAVAWHNGRHLVPQPWQDRAATVATVVGAVLASWWLFRQIDLLEGIESVWAWTLAAVVPAGIVALLARLSRRVGTVVWDRRMAQMSRGTFAAHVGIRIPVLTAFAEEVVHRGVVWWALEGVGGTTLALWGSTATFALGHLVVARDQAVREGREGAATWTWVATTVVATGLAGLFLGWLRLRTGGIWAGVGVHAAVNMVLAFGGRFARREPGESARAAGAGPASAEDGQASRVP